MKNFIGNKIIFNDIGYIEPHGKENTILFHHVWNQHRCSQNDWEDFVEPLLRMHGVEFFLLHDKDY